MESLELANYFDHTLLKPTATLAEIKILCEEAAKYRFFSVCVNPIQVKYASDLLATSEVKVCSVVGFPLGAHSTQIKATETSQAIADGADEIDMVMNIGAFKDKRYDLVEQDIRAVVKAADGKPVKVILETCFLQTKEIVEACELASGAEAHYVKTSTGFGGGGATVEDVALMKKAVGNQLKVKASGGIKTYPDALKMIEAGADRIGASAGVAIIEELLKE